MTCPAVAGVQPAERSTDTTHHGYAGGSVRTIANRIGVSPAALLQHFGSKEGLLMAVLEDWDRRTVEAQLTDVTGLDYFRRLPEVLAANVTVDAGEVAAPPRPRSLSKSGAPIPTYLTTCPQS